MPKYRLLASSLGVLFFLTASVSEAVVTTYCCDVAAETAYKTAIAATAYDTAHDSFEAGEWVNFAF